MPDYFTELLSCSYLPSARDQLYEALKQLCEQPLQVYPGCSKFYTARNRAFTLQQAYNSLTKILEARLTDELLKKEVKRFSNLLGQLKGTFSVLETYASRALDELNDMAYGDAYFEEYEQQTAQDEQEIRPVNKR